MKWTVAVTALTAAIAAILLGSAGAPRAAAAEQLLEVIDVPADGTRVQSTTVLRPNATYSVTVAATIEVTYPDGRIESVLAGERQTQRRQRLRLTDAIPHQMAE